MANVTAIKLGRQFLVFGYPQLFAGLALHDADATGLTVCARHSNQIALALAGVERERSMG